MRKTLFALLVAAVAMAAVLAGCGGDDGDTTGESETVTLTKAQYIKQADAICDKGSVATVKGYDAFYTKYPISQGQKLTAAQETELVETVLVPNIKKQLEELETLPAPEGDEAEIEKFIGSLSEGLEAGEDEPLTLFRSNMKNPLVAATENAAAYGITHCGGGGG